MSTPSERPRVTVERRGHVLLIGLDRAAKRNAFDLRAVGRARAAPTASSSATTTCACGVLYAHGDHFTGGLDLAEWAPVVRRRDAPIPEGGLDPLGLVGPRWTKPVVAAVQGICLTIGIELLLATDIRVAADDVALRPDRDQARHLPGRRRDAALPARGRLGQRDALAAHRRRVRRRRGAPHRPRAGGRRARPRRRARRSRSPSTIAAQAPARRPATLASARRAPRGRGAARQPAPAGPQAAARERRRAEGLASFVERRPARFTGR